MKLFFLLSLFFFIIHLFTIPCYSKTFDFDFHEIKGCPENSTCTSESGKLYIKWNDLLKSLNSKTTNTQLKKANLLEDFRKHYGIPIDFWIKDNIPSNISPWIVTWDSPCLEHQKNNSNSNSNDKNNGPKIQIAEAFVKNTVKNTHDKNLNLNLENKNIFLKPLLIEYAKDDIETYYLSSEDNPNYVINKNIMILKEADGVFFNLQISANGNWKIIDYDFTNKENNKNNDDINCPKTLTNHFVKQINKNNFYRYFYCKKIKDLSSKKEFTALVALRVPFNKLFKSFS
ncbi:MAG: hypothetical protein HQK51_14575 [Oligoflexia bacterium]|nr:hypothetical protein [Oligoflexia bacterium]